MKKKATKTSSVKRATKASSMEQETEDRVMNEEINAKVESSGAPAVEAEESTRSDTAHGLSKKYIYSAMGVGLIPVPIVDLAAISLIQLKLLHNLANHYDTPFSKDAGKAIIGSLVGGTASTPVGMSLASLTKSIPIIGTVVGAASVLLAAGASTYALSRIFIQHFEAGGTFLNFDPAAVREYFAKEFEKGKALLSSKKSKAA